MAVYIVLLSVFLSASSIVQISKIKNKKKVVVIVGAILIILVSGLRSYNVGWDTLNYVNIYESIGDGVLYELKSKNMEKGYLMLNELLHLVSENPRFLLFFTSVLTTVIISINVYRNSCDAVLSIFLYITLYGMNFSMSGIRQGIAIAMVSLAIEEILNNNVKTFFILIVIGSLFHNTAIFFLVLYAAYKLKPTYKNLFVLSGALIASVSFFTVIIDIVVVVFPRFSVYLGSSYFQGVELGKQSILWLIIFTVILFMCMFFLPKEYEKENKRRLFVYAVIMLLGCAFILFSTKISIAERMVRYINVFSIFVFPYMINHIRRGLALIYYISYVSFSLIYIYVLMLGTYGALPYEFFV